MGKVPPELCLSSPRRGAAENLPELPQASLAELGDVGHLPVGSALHAHAAELLKRLADGRSHRTYAKHLGQFGGGTCRRVKTLSRSGCSPD